MTYPLAEKVKESVSCRDFAERNGIVINRSSFCCCPFHGEKTPSLKIYPGGKSWYCFGCHIGGDVIAFAMRYYDCRFVDAVRKLAQEFGLGDGLDNLSAAVKAAKNKAFRHQKIAKAEKLEKEYWAVYEKWIKIDSAITDFSPSFDGDYDSRFVSALIERDETLDYLDWLSYSLGVLRNGK